MDFRFSKEEEAFRREVRDFLARELPAGWLTRESDWEGGDDAAWEVSRQWARKLGRKGWLVMAWPRQYGGVEASPIEQLILREQLAYFRAPDEAYRHAVGWVGPALMLNGSEEQKKEFLPRIAGGEMVCCTLFSEPGAGSDLASLKVQAVQDGDDYVINGQKVFNTFAHRADYGWLAARTDPEAPKHRGISNLLVDMKTPGITVRPLVNLMGLHSLNEVFFDNVRIPQKMLVGQKNMGWYQTAASLDFERSGVGYAAGCQRILGELVDYASRQRRNGQTLTEDPAVRHKLASIAVEIEVSRYLSYRVAWMQSQGLNPNYEAAMSKMFGSELIQRVARLGMEVLGLYGQLEGGSKGAPLAGKVGRAYLSSLGSTIAAGTSEIQRNVIAWRGLGLPR